MRRKTIAQVFEVIMVIWWRQREQKREGKETKIKEETKYNRERL